MKCCDPKTITFADDKLGRDKYADFLIELVRNVESKEGSYTIAVNAPYGSGKTTLLQMMCSRIKEKFSTTNVEKPLTVVYYNAWRYDFFNEPLVPLASSLFEQDELKDQDTYNTMIRKAKTLAFLANGALNHFTGIDMFDACQKAKSTTGKEEEFLQYGKVIDDLSDALNDAVKEYGNNAKLLVIIDELDRCRPDFAIQTLEITKHLLMNEDIVFMYALDIGQLQKAVENAYGEGMDSAGYLLRFFDYITTIPKADKSKYIEAIVEIIEGKPYIEDVSKEMESCCESFQLTLRDIDRILATYKHMHTYFLKEYQNEVAHRLYLHLLCLKYKKSSWFESIVGFNQKMNSEVSGYYGGKVDSRTIAYRIKMIIQSMETTRIRVKQDKLSFPFYIYYENKEKSKMFKNLELHIVEGKPLICNSSESVTSLHYMENNDILGYGIFPEDIQKIIKSRPKNIQEYIHHQMEFFNFETGLNEEEKEK